MTPTDTARLRHLILESQTAPWPVAAVRAKAALATAMEQDGEALLDLAQRALELPPDRPVGQLVVDAEYGRNRRRNQAGYAREHEARRGQTKALRKAQTKLLDILAKIEGERSYIGCDDVPVMYGTRAETEEFRSALADYMTARRAAALSDLAQADAELLDAAE